MTLNWTSNDYFSMLMHRDKRAHAALEMLVDDLHAEKERTINIFLSHSGSEDFLWGLVRLLASENTRVAGNAAYIIGTLAECELGCFRVLALTNCRNAEAKRILVDLTNMLTYDDQESVMNAAGTMGTLAESAEGRAWMLSEPCLEQTMDNVTNLLKCENQWTASNAALVLARITIAEEGCVKLLEHKNSRYITSRLVASLGVDEAGRGMNAAFAIGRLCDTDEGRKCLLGLPESEKMISCLAKMLCCNDPGSSKNACFALSCLAASVEGHSRIINNSYSDEVLRTLSELLSAEDPETGWFAAMTLRTLASQPKGCLKLRDHHSVVTALQAMENKSDVNEDLMEEVTITLEILKRLSKPAAPVLEVKGSHEIEAAWQEMPTKSGFIVRYQLFDGTKCLYQGKDLSFTVKGLSPHTKYGLRVRGVTEGDESPFSDVSFAATEESVPGPPRNVRILGCTATQLKVGWEPPEFPNGALKGYNVYLGKNLVEHTNELSSIITGLHATTSYEVYVCAGTAKGKGPKAAITADTADTGAHCPSKPQLSILGRNEIHVTWNPPEVPVGRITRYDVLMNGKVVYSGTELHCTARRLTPNTEYTFVVCALTNEGRFESKESKKKTPKNEYDPDRAPLYQAPHKREATMMTVDDNKPPVIRRKKSSGATSNFAQHDDPKHALNTRLLSAESSKGHHRHIEGIPKRPISATSNANNTERRNSISKKLEHAERLSSGKSSKSSNEGSIKVVEDANKSEVSNNTSPEHRVPGSHHEHGLKKLMQELNDSGSDSSTDKNRNGKHSKIKTRSRTCSDASEKSEKILHAIGRKTVDHRSDGHGLGQVRSPQQRSKSDTSHKRSDVLTQDLLPNSASKINSRGHHLDRDKLNGPLHRPINLTGVKSHYETNMEGFLRPFEREATVMEPDPSWIAMTKKYSENDMNNRIAMLNMKYSPPKSPRSVEDPLADLEAPMLGKPLPVPQNFVDRANTFVGSHRPSKKPSKQLYPSQMMATHSSQVKIDVELPCSQASKNNSKFIPMGYRSPQLKLPGGGMQRGVTSLNMSNKGGMLNPLVNVQSPCLGIKLDGLARSHTQLGSIKPNSSLAANLDAKHELTGFTLTSTKLSSDKLAKGNSRDLKTPDLHNSGNVKGHSLLTDLKQW